MGAYTLILRVEGRTEKQRFDALPTALDALEREARAFAATERREGRSIVTRTYEPVNIVALRAELKGPGLRCGIDVRGDGSAGAYTGRWGRRLIDLHDGEDAYAALRRTLDG
ncbi:unannotated protein [freshwater metagenome]|uniref:Unannotated protein n=1 Tax=freshwater metagenome TaxID=449393 RepID=A0A6J7DYP6_9ZZZZ|nr:hypothetical protein [Actinomycetota bacterium]